MTSIPTYLLKRVLKDNADVRRNPSARAYLIDSDERLVYWPIEPLDTKHDGFAIYVEISGLTRAIYREGQPTTRAWGSQLLHDWLDAVHERNRRGAISVYNVTVKANDGDSNPTYTYLAADYHDHWWYVEDGWDKRTIITLEVIDKVFSHTIKEN